MLPSDTRDEDSADGTRPSRGVTHHAQMVDAIERASGFTWRHGAQGLSTDLAAVLNAIMTLACSCGDYRRRANHRKTTPCWVYVGSTKYDLAQDGRIKGQREIHA